MFEIYRWASIILFSVTLTHKVSSSILIGCRIGIILVYILKKRGAIYKDSQYFLYKDMVRPRLVTFAYTAVLYVLYMVDSGSEVFIGAAISETVQQFVFIAVGLAFFEISKEKAIQNIFIAVLINYSVTLFVAFRSLGLSGVIGYLKSPGTALSSVTTYFEIHGLMFALGILLIYFILFENKSVKQHRLKILVCLFFVYCGYKRIEFLAVVLAMLMFIFLKNKGIRWIIFGGCATVLAFVYIGLTENGTIINLLSEHNINSMGRDLLYDSAHSLYTLGIEFLGHGVGATRKLLGDGSMLHNNILQFYIEYGFLGTVFWIGYQMVYLPMRFNKQYGYSVALYYGIISWYLFITYLTDNTAGYIAVQNVLFVSLSYFIDEEMDLMAEYDSKIEGTTEFIQKIRKAPE